MLQIVVCKETTPINQHTQPTIGDEGITDLPFQKLCMDFVGKTQSLNVTSRSLRF